MESTLNPTRTTNFVIDSTDRDMTRFPLASHYEIILDEAIHDVVTMHLLIADVPFVSYLIHETNNMITASMVGGGQVIGWVPVGDYTGPELANAVQTALQSQSTSSMTFTSSYSALTDNINVGCNIAFALIFGSTGSIALELGFATGTSYLAAPSTSASQYVATPPYRRNSHLNPSIILSILPASVNTSVNQNINQSFAVISKNRSILSAAANDLPQKTFNPPIARFSRVTVDFVNYDGTPVDFQNHDHHIELMLISLRSAKYQPFDGLRTA